MSSCLFSAGPYNLHPLFFFWYFLGIFCFVFFPLEENKVEKTFEGELFKEKYIYISYPIYIIYRYFLVRCCSTMCVPEGVVSPSAPQLPITRHLIYFSWITFSFFRSLHNKKCCPVIFFLASSFDSSDSCFLCVVPCNDSSLSISIRAPVHMSKVSTLRRTYPEHRDGWPLSLSTIDTTSPERNYTQRRRRRKK